MAYTFSLLTITETNTFTKFCTKHLSSPIRYAKKHSLRRRWDETVQPTLAKFYCTMVNKHSLSQRIQININTGSSVKTESRRTTSVNDLPPHTIYSTHTLTCGKSHYMTKCYAVTAVVRLGSVFNLTPCTSRQPLQETLEYNINQVTIFSISLRIHHSQSFVVTTSETALPL
jgi:hypothetical protein